MHTAIVDLHVKLSLFQSNGDGTCSIVAYAYCDFARAVQLPFVPMPGMNLRFDCDPEDNSGYTIDVNGGVQWNTITETFILYCHREDFGADSVKEFVARMKKEGWKCSFRGEPFPA